MKTLSAKLVSARTFALAETEIPPLGEGQVLLEVLSCGICSSELRVFEGYDIGTPGVSFRYKAFPADLGHEVVGVVVDRGPAARRFQPGDCVTGLTYSGCGFARHFVEKETALAAVPALDGAEREVAMGEPLMATSFILREIQPGFGETLLVVGDGFMALLLIAALGRYPLKDLIVVGHHENRLALARAFGATLCMDSRREDAWKIIMERTGHGGVDTAVEYGGSPDALRLAASVCKAKQRAKLVLAATYDNAMPFTVANYLQNRAPTLVPAYPSHSPAPAEDLARGLWGWALGIYPMARLVTHRYSLGEVGQGFLDCMQRRDGYIKGVVFPQR